MADQVAEFTAYILAQYPISAPALIRAMELKDERIAALEAQVATPSPPVAAPPATPALSDEQIGAICDQFKTLIRQKRQTHLRRGYDAGADYYIGNVANYVGHAVKEAANARIAELVAENKMLSRSLDESLFVDLQCVAERAAAQPAQQLQQAVARAADVCGSRARMHSQNNDHSAANEAKKCAAAIRAKGTHD